MTRMVALCSTIVTPAILGETWQTCILYTEPLKIAVTFTAQVLKVCRTPGPTACSCKDW